MKNTSITVLLALVIMATRQSYAAPNAGEYKFRLAGDDLVLNAAEDDDSEDFNLLFPIRRPSLRPDIDRRHHVVSTPGDGPKVDTNNNMVPSETGIVFNDNFAASELLPKSVVSPPKNSNIPPAAADNMDKVISIAFNNREVKLVGPDSREVEVKGDAASQMALALENLQKETTEVWGQVNEKLDKGWTEFKTMVERAVAKRSAPTSSSSYSARQLREAPEKSYGSYIISDIDGYSMADNDDSSTLAKQAETAGNKIKGFFSNIGLNEENGKKANEALSKAGASVSETMTKDLPDALKKAGSAVSETVTKDIPDAIKNFFG